MPSFAELPQHIFYFAVVLGLLTASFLLFYFVPAVLISTHLGRVTRKLAAIKGEVGRDFSPIFAKTGVLEALWSEYSTSLHHQYVGASGNDQEVRLRSTVPASLVFRSEMIVDTTLHTDFFKHLPGLFTGIGIIGTFYGLLVGLQAFDISDNPVIVRNSLKLLLHGVSEAFLVSASAITLAMAITFVEKLTIAHLNAKVERFTQLLDGLFEGGSNEEYLARLVEASETAASKNANLVEGDLRQLLSDLMAKQTIAFNGSIAALGNRIVTSLDKGFDGPVREIATLLSGERNDQDLGLQKMLNEALSLFSQRLEKLFGSQVVGINDLQQQTIQALQAAVATLQTMAEKVDQAGRQTAESLANTLAESAAGAEARQRTMNDKMAEFVDQMRQAIDSAQGDTQELMRTALEELTVCMKDAIAQLSAQAKLAAEASGKQQIDLAENTRDVIGQFGAQVGALLEGVSRAAVEIKAAATAMRNTTSDAMVRLNSGADTL